jgi:hypothetical protein
MNAIKEFATRVKAIMATAKAPANGGDPGFVGGPGAGVGGAGRRESIETQTTRGHGGAGQPSQYLSDYITPAAGLQQFRLLVGSKFSFPLIHPNPFRMRGAHIVRKATSPMGR